MTKVIPMGTRVLIQRDETEKQKNGLILPNEEKKNTGIVKAVGDDCKKLKDGDRVLFPVYPLAMYEDLLIYKEEDILAILLT